MNPSLKTLFFNSQLKHQMKIVTSLFSEEIKKSSLLLIIFPFNIYDSI